QRCLHGSPCGLKYGQEHEARSFEPRSRTRTRYFAVPRTRATTSPGRDAIRVTRPLTKYDWPRARTAPLKFRETFWPIPIVCSPWGWVILISSWRGGRRIGLAGRRSVGSLVMLILKSVRRGAAPSPGHRPDRPIRAAGPRDPRPARGPRARIKSLE